jgi:hypothetical protein
MDNVTMQDLVNSTQLRNMDWKSVTFGSLIYTKGKWYLFLDSHILIPLERSYSWEISGLNGDVNKVQCLCDMNERPISFFHEFQQMLIELINTGRTFR